MGFVLLAGVTEYVVYYSPPNRMIPLMFTTLGTLWGVVFFMGLRDDAHRG